MEPFRELGLAMERAWERVDYEPGALARIAPEHLEAAALHRRVAVDDLVEWGLRSHELPEQDDAKGDFGEPPLTLFSGRKFSVSALFWVDGTTSIHQHAFSGAFQVLAGSSIHTAYDFTPRRVVSAALMLGRLTARASHQLSTGAVEPIAAGGSSIHALFHLERPTVSIVVRTFAEPGARPQWSYLHPGVAFDPFYEEPWALRRVQLVRMMAATESPRFEQRVGDLVASSDLHTAFLLLQGCRRLPDLALVDRLAARLAERHPDVAEDMAAALRDQRRDHMLVARREAVKDPQLRFFLAVLLNVRSRRRSLELVGASFPRVDPVEKILGWLRGLSEVTFKVQIAGTPWEPNAFGLPALDEAALSALGARLRGAPASAVEDEASRRLVERLERSLFFAPLFADEAEPGDLGHQG